MEILSALENVLEELSVWVRGEPELRQELASSRAEFFGGEPSGRGAEQALRRHLEWFLFERFSPSLEGVPVDRLRERWSESQDDADGALASALLGSLCGIFEVTGVEPGEGLWLRDLLGGGEYPLCEPEVTEAFAVGDLLAGRIFPVGESLFYASPAAGAFRNAQLLEALREDMQRLRLGRRGSLRISQVEVERMFFGVEEPAASGGAGAAEARAAARELLLEGGLSSSELDIALSELWNAPFEADRIVHGVDDALADLLDRLAFETEVDLNEARRALLEAWSLTAAEVRGPAAEPSATPPPGPRSGSTRSGSTRQARPAASDPRDALAAFDQGRAAGKDLDALFDQLERDLGLDGEGDGEDEVAPDFPGVVGAMVEEFLWETERDGGEAARSQYEGLRGFAEYASEIGVFENLTSRDLVTFTCVFAVEEALLRSESEARGLLAAVAAFARWSEREHDLELWKGFRGAYEGLCENLPRIASMNTACEPRPAPSTALFEVLGVEGDRVSALDREGDTHGLTVPGELAPSVQKGDLLRGALERPGALTVVACYPPEARAVLFDA